MLRLFLIIYILNSITHAKEVLIHSGTLEDRQRVAIDLSQWKPGETYYFHFIIVGASNEGGKVSGIAFDIDEEEQIFIGDAVGLNTPWAVLSQPEKNNKLTLLGQSLTPKLDGKSTYYVTLAITQGENTSANTFKAYFTQDIDKQESQLTPPINGLLDQVDVKAITHIRTVTNDATIRDAILFTEGDSPFTKRRPLPKKVITDKQEEVVEGAPLISIGNVSLILQD